MDDPQNDKEELFASRYIQFAKFKPSLQHIMPPKEELHRRDQFLRVNYFLHKTIKYKDR